MKDDNWKKNPNTIDNSCENVTWKTKTYKSTLVSDALFATMKKLHKKHENPINFLKEAWNEIAPNWAKEAQPSMIKNKILFMITTSKNATILQYKEADLLKIASTILNIENFENLIERIKILKKNENE